VVPSASIQHPRDWPPWSSVFSVTVPTLSWSLNLPGLIGKEIGGRKVVDIKHIPGKGTVLVVEKTKEILVDEIIDQLSLAK
jgi:hypothetical protein